MHSDTKIRAGILTRREFFHPVPLYTVTINYILQLCSGQANDPLYRLKEANYAKHPAAP